MPDNVKAVISRLSVQDQVVIRSYIAGMRDELKELKVKLEHADDDPHAHYHGHEKCTADHGHKHHSHDHKKEEEHHPHDHHHHGQEKCTEDHSHDHNHKKCEEHDVVSSHDHSHNHHKKEEHHHHHEHAHDHHEKEEDVDMPAWKKQALDADPNAAPFGGSWNTESSMDATK